MAYSMLIKFGLLFIFINLIQVRSHPTDVSNSSQSSTSAPAAAAVLVENLNLLVAMNDTKVEPSSPKNASDEVKDYYNWLSFIRTSTSTESNSHPMP